MSALRAAVFGLCVAVVATGGAGAQEPFYKGKRLTVLVNYAAGGPADVEARLFAKYIGRHIAGSPSVIVQNIDGAGGLVGTTYVGEVAPKDGSVIGYLSGAAWRYVNDPERHRIDFKSYEFIAQQSGTSVYYVRSDVAPGMTAAADIAKAKGLIAGGLGPENAKDLRIRLTLDLLGVPFKYVTGYRSSPPARLALQRGEINFYSESAPGYRAIVHPGIVKAGEAVPVYYDPVYADGALGRAKSMAGLPIATFTELYQELNGKPPSGPLWDAYDTILTVIGAMQLVQVAPPGTPKASIDALRAAVAGLDGDKDYADEALKSIGFVPEWQSGPETNPRVRAALAVRPQTRAFIADYIRTANK
jgi:tripartite-type tricarboxylate transporter receptor subunit TctC